MTIDEFVVIDKCIDAAEEQATDSIRESLRHRWQFGKLLLAERKGKQLPKGRMAELVKATGKSETELKYRARFAERYPTEDEIGRALPTFTSWTQVKNSLPKPPPEKPKPPTPPKPKPEPKWKNPELHDAIKDGATVTELKTQFDISDSTIGEARRFLEGQAEPVIVDYNTLPRSAEHRVDVLRRQIRRELEDEFEPKVRAEVQRRLDKAFDRVAEQYDRIQRFESAQRHGVFTKSDYNLIKSCLHPDSRASVSDEKLANAFRLFNQADIKLVPPSKPGDLPSLDELRRRRQADKR